PAKRGGTPPRPAGTGTRLTGGAAYEPEPPAQGLLGRPREVDAEEASFDGYFGAFGTPAPTTDSAPGTTSAAEDARPADPRPASGSGGFARPGSAAEGGGVTSAAGAGRDQDDAEAEGAQAPSGANGTPGPGAWGPLTPDADGPAGPGDPHRCDPGGSA
ncbi:hypothetical protein ACFW9B_39635, partial [Streptomyces yangpuensis]